jgi:hypothetical protein
MNIITVYYNFANYKSRYESSLKCIQYLNQIPNINLYIIELAYCDQQYVLTDKNNKNHLQLRCNHPLWHKENLINIGITKLLPKDWEYVAWIDCNVHFENSDFVKKTLNKLQEYDFVQMFSTLKCIEYNSEKYTEYGSLMYYVSKNEYSPTLKPGGAWACTKKGYNSIGKLYDKSLCESDCILAHALGLHRNYHMSAKNCKYLCDVDLYVNNIIKQQLKVSYVDNIMVYYWHGNQENRKYHLFRHKMLTKIKYDPDFFTYDGNCLLIPSDLCPLIVLNEFKKYFESRQEDLIT